MKLLPITPVILNNWKSNEINNLIWSSPFMMMPKKAVHYSQTLELISISDFLIQLLRNEVCSKLQKYLLMIGIRLKMEFW